MRARRALIALAAAAALAPVPPATPASADGLSDLEWGIDAVHAPEAWQQTKGKGITVAVLDTGVDSTHPDLLGQVLDGKDAVGFGAEPGDGHWARHGTAMAGIIAGQARGTEGNPQGVRGVAPEVKILPVRVILEDSDPKRKKAREQRGGALAEGIRWAADHGADVINLSLGDDSKTARAEEGEDEAVQYALRKGVVVVASAGNGGRKGERASYPAAYPGVISVTAVDQKGKRAYFSTRRWYATVAAPGVDILIADPDRNYYEGWGTSAAAAFASGVVALVRSAHPDLSPVQIKQLLQDTARHTPTGGRSDALGAGVLDAAAAIQAGAKLKPRAQKPAPAAAERRYFGAGPAPMAQAGGDGPAPLALAAGIAGVGALAGAYVVWRGPRRREADRAPLPSTSGAQEHP